MHMHPTIGFPAVTVLVFLILAGGAFFYDMLSGICIQKMTLQQAVRRSIGFAMVGVIFGLFVTVYHSHEDGMRYFAGLMMEQALSVDNLMMFTAIFAYFGIPAIHQRRILTYGIAGAVVFRGIFLAGGIGLFLALGRATEIAFGILILWSAFVLFRSGENPTDEDFERKWYVRAAKRVWPIMPRGDEFFTQVSGVTYATKAFLCLLAVEMSDIMFSFDSVPAVIGITQDPLLIYAAVIFAVLGLRAMYFVLEALRDSLHYLSTAVAVILVFIGMKLIGHAVWEIHISALTNVGIVAAVLATGVLASLYDPKEKAA